MKKSPGLLVLLVALSLATGALAVWGLSQHRQLLAARTQAAQLVADMETQQKKTAAAEGRLRAAADARGKTAAAQTTSSGAAKTAATASGPKVDGSLAMLDNPAVQTMMARSAKSGLDQRYGLLFRKLKLSPAELDKFKDLLTERQMSGLDVMRAAQQQGINPMTQGDAYESLLGKAQQEVDESIRTLIGDMRFSQYNEFNQNIGTYGVLDQVERRLSYTSTPLQDGQTEAVMRVLSETLKTPDTHSAMGTFAQAMSGSNPMIAAMNQPAITDKTIEAAQGVLSVGQIEVLKQLQAEQRAQQDVLKGFRPPAVKK